MIVATSLVAASGQFVAQNAIDAIAYGALYALFALGIALIFGVMQLVNFAHGELIMAAGFTLFLLQRLPWPAQAGIAVLTAIAAALAMDRIGFRPVRGKNPATLLVTSFAISYFLQNLAYMIFGAVPKAINFLPGLSSAWFVGSITIPKLSVVIVAVTVGLLVVLAGFLSRTKLGLQMRASAENFDMARLCGVRANTVIAAAFAISGLLAGVASLLLVAQTGQVTTTMGVNVILFAFVATILGGMGSLAGAVLGGFLVGALTIVLQAFLPLELRPYRDAFVFAAVFVTLVVRPGGLILAPSTQGRV